MRFGKAGPTSGLRFTTRVGAGDGTGTSGSTAGLNGAIGAIANDAANAKYAAITMSTCDTIMIVSAEEALVVFGIVGGR